jgi:hypothetical protein
MRVLALLLSAAVSAVDFSFLSDKELLLSTRLAEPGALFASGPFLCGALVSRRCASLGPRFTSSACGEALPEGAPGLPPGGASVVHGDAYNRTFLFFACAEEEASAAAAAAASLAARGSVLARVGAARGRKAARPRSVWAEEPPAARGGWAAEAALPALPEERAPACAAERATRVVCAQTQPRRGSGGGGGGEEVGVGALSVSGSASAPWGTRCSCMLRATGGLDEAPFPAS